MLSMIGYALGTLILLVILTAIIVAGIFGVKLIKWTWNATKEDLNDL